MTTNKSLLLGALLVASGVNLWAFEYVHFDDARWFVSYPFANGTLFFVSGAAIIVIAAIKEANKHN